MIAVFLVGLVHPPVIISVLAVLIGLCRLKPRMIDTSVIDDQIHDDFHVSAVCFVKQSLKIILCSVIGIHRHVIRHGISVVGIGRSDRHEPYPIDPELLQIVKFLRDAIQIAYTITV